MYAYVAQYAEKHVPGFGTEYRLVAKLFLSDGTEGVYEINTDAGTVNTNSFKDYQYTKNNNALLHALNGKDSSGHVTATRVGNRSTYDATKFNMSSVLSDFSGSTSGLGVFKATVRADGTVVLAKLSGTAAAGGVNNALFRSPAENANRADIAKAKAVTGHSTLIATVDAGGMQAGKNVTNGASPDQALYQTGKTVFFYINGQWGDGADQADLTVGVETGIDKMKKLTSGDDNDIEEAPYRVSGTTTGYEKKFLQVFSVDSNSNYDNRVEGRREVNAELIYGVSYTNDNLYFYHRGNYTVDWVNGSRADGEKASITFEMYDVDGNRVDKTYDNGGKYFEEVEIRGMVDSKETGWYTFGAEDLKQIISFNGVETVYDGSEIYNSNSTKWSSLISNKMFVINADVDHVDYENNIYTTDERVGGITKDAVIVDVTGTGLFDDARDIDSACRAGHKVLISYYYNTTGNDAYKVKAVFVTGYDPYENPGNDNRQGDVYSVYNSASGRLNVYDNGKASRMDVMNSAVRAYQDAGFTVTNAYPTMFGGRYWGMTITREGWTPRYVTNDPNATGNNNSYVANSNYYMDEVDALNAVFVSSSRSENYRFAAYRLSGENYTYAVNNPYYATYTVKYAGTDTALTGYSDVMLGTNSQGNVNVRYPSNGVMQDSYDIYLTLKTSGTVDEDNFATLTAGYPAGITVDNEAYTAGKKLSVGQHGFNVTMDSAKYYTVFVNGAIVESTASAGTAGKKVVSFQAKLVKGGNTISIQASDEEFSGGTLNITPKDATVKDDKNQNVTWANNAFVAVGTYTVTATVDKGDEYVVTVNGTKLDSTSVKTAANGADSSKMDLTFSVSVVKGKTTVVEAKSVTYQGTLNIDPAKDAVVKLNGTDVNWSEKNNKLKVGTYSVTVVVPKGDGYSVTNNGINVSSVAETADGNNMKLTFNVTIAKDQTVNIKAVSQTKGDGIKVETTADTNKVPKGAVLTVADVSSEDNQTLSKEDINGVPVDVKVDLSSVASANRGITGNTFDEDTFYWVQINNVAFGPVKGSGTSELVFRVILTIEQVQNNTLVLEELFQSENGEITPDLPAGVIEKAPEKVAPFTVKSAVIYNQKTLEDANADKIINIDQFVGGSGWTDANEEWKTEWLSKELTPQPSFAIRLIKTDDFENSEMSFKMTGIEIGGKKYNMNQWKGESEERTYTWVKDNYNNETGTERWFQVAILKDMAGNTAPSTTGDAISINNGDKVVVYLEYDGIEIPVEGVYGGVNLTPEIRESYKTTGKPPVVPEDTEITSITVTNSTGKVEDGTALDEAVANYKVAEKGITIKGATWAEKTAAPTARAAINAEAGKTYTLTLSVDVADGKTVSDKAAIKVNVGGVEVTGKYTATPGTRAVTSGTITADFTVPAKDTQPTEINKITIANAKGKVEVGQELDTTVDNYEVSEPKTGLTITKVDWARKESGSSRASAEAGDYTLTLTVSLADGVTVADNANITITAGGLTGTNGKFEATQTGRAATTGTITADFTLTNTQSEGGNGGGGR